MNVRQILLSSAYYKKNIRLKLEVFSILRLTPKNTMLLKKECIKWTIRVKIVQVTRVRGMNCFKPYIVRAYFNHLLRTVPASSALSEKRNAFSSTKNSKNTCHLGNALNLGKWGVKTHNCVLSLDVLALFWLYRTHALIFWNKPWLYKNILISIIHVWYTFP